MDQLDDGNPTITATTINNLVMIEFAAGRNRLADLSEAILEKYPHVSAQQAFDLAFDALHPQNIVKLLYPHLVRHDTVVPLRKNPS